MKRLAIGDIHGCLKTFQALLERIDYSKGDELYLLGDYIDRGPDSKGVIDYIMTLLEADNNIICLKGNHEQLLLEALADGNNNKRWVNNGGIQTLMSYESKTVRDLPEKHLEFYQKLPFYVTNDDFIFVHGGLNFTIKSPLKDGYSMIWERAWYDKVDYNWLGKKTIVHGHTPATKEEIEDMGRFVKLNQYINIDCGCYVAQRRQDMGFLTAFNLDTHELTFQKCVDEVIF